MPVSKEMFDELLWNDISVEGFIKNILHSPNIVGTYKEAV